MISDFQPKGELYETVIKKKQRFPASTRTRQIRYNAMARVVMLGNNVLPRVVSIIQQSRALTGQLNGTGGGFFCHDIGAKNTKLEATPQNQFR